MRRDESAGEKLGAEEGEVVADWEDFGFCVKIADGCHLHAASGDSEGGILETLEFGNGSG